MKNRPHLVIRTHISQPLYGWKLLLPLHLGRPASNAPGEAKLLIEKTKV